MGQFHRFTTIGIKYHCLYSLRTAHRKWKETKQQPRTAGPGNMLGCCLVSFHFLLTILSTSTVPVLVVVAEPGGVDVVPVLSPAPAVPQVGVVRQLPEVAPAPEK